MRKRQRRIGFYDVYKRYPYKVMTSNDAWFKVGKKEHTEHEFSLSFFEWRDMVKEILDEFLDDLYTGLPVKLPYYMGTLQLLKYKRGPRVDHPKTAKARKTSDAVLYKNLALTDGYGLLVKWTRINKKATRFYIFSICRRQFVERYRKIDNIYKFSG